MEKYGFVYIWFDRKHKRYYIGMHWGREDDGYICSSTWMKNAYKRRPEDFKRRVLNRVYSNRKELYEKEKYWLSLIKEKELKVKYYNLSKNVTDTWLNEDSILARNQKISIKTKEAMQRPEVREKYLKGIENRPLPSKETREKRKISMIETMAIKYPIENRKKPKTSTFEEYVELHRNNTIKLWENRTDEEREFIGNSISNSLKGKEKTGKAAKGHTKDIEVKKKLSNSNKIAYQNMSEEKKKERSKKISLKNKGKKRNEEQKRLQSERIKLMWEKRRNGLIPMPNYNKSKSEN